MLISFIIPAFNVEKYIGECVDSILCQDTSEINDLDYEIIVVNDGSTDRTKEMLENYKSNKKVQIVNTKNRGVSAARNTGCDLAKGEWLFFVDGDDRVDRNLLACSYSGLIRKEVEVCFVQHQEWLPSKINPNEFHQSQNITMIDLNETDFQEFIRATFNRDIPGKFDYHELKMATPCKFYRKTIIDNNHIKFPENIKTGEDAIFNIKYYKKVTNGLYIKKKLYYHRIIKTSVSNRYNPMATKDFDALHQNLWEFVKGDETLLPYFKERCLWSIGFCCKLDFLSSSNPNGYYIRKESFEYYRSKYLDLILDVNLADFRFKKRIMLYLIQQNCFFLLDIVSRIGII